MFKRQADETYQITAKGITITTTEEHPFWVPGRGWIEARHLKAGDLLQNPEGKPYPIDRIEIKKNSTTVYNFRVEGVHNYFVTELEIWTHNCGAGGMRNIPMRAPSGGGGGSSSKSMSEAPKNINLVKDNYLKKNNIDAHQLKGDVVGKKNISKYDIYKDKDSGQLFVYKKGGREKAFLRANILIREVFFA
ncbi:polymorphic toxin type 33 domain-containing protein [Paenibacillus melissococcoides]|nr:polymorphic toxin type 33 domain-containing protein [Paenibacillus melissococcoides]